MNGRFGWISLAWASLMLVFAAASAFSAEVVEAEAVAPRAPLAQAPVLPRSGAGLAAETLPPLAATDAPETAGQAAPEGLLTPLPAPSAIAPAGQSLPAAVPPSAGQSLAQAPQAATELSGKNAQKALILTTAISEMLLRYQTKIDLLSDFSSKARRFMRDPDSPMGFARQPAEQFVPIADRLRQSSEELRRHYDQLAHPLEKSTDGGAVEQKVVNGAFRTSKINPVDLGNLGNFYQDATLLDASAHHVVLLEQMIRRDLSAAEQAARRVYEGHFKTVTVERPEMKLVTTVKHPWYRLFLPLKETSWAQVGTRLEKQNKPPFIGDELLAKLRAFYEEPMPAAVSRSDEAAADSW